MLCKLVKWLRSYNKMPLYKFKSVSGERGCDKCSSGFTKLLSKDKNLSFCPYCGAEIEKVIESVNILPSMSRGDLSSDRLDELGLSQMIKKPDGTWRVRGRPLSENDSLKPDVPDVDF
jgi:predicted nucleic acid-binding Zn ribbon protein